MNYRLIPLIGVLLFSTSVTAERTLVLARAPQLSPSIISQQWSPFVEYLSKATGIKIILKVYSKRQKFERDITDGKVDLYFGNPGYGVVGHLKHGYTPLIRSGKKLLKGIIVVRKDSGINNIQQLKGRVISFPGKSALAASLYIRAHLESDFNLEYKPIFSRTHDDTYRSVLIGKASAGGGVVRTLKSEDKKLREQLQIIYTTPGMKSHPLMAHPRLSEDIRKSIQKVILSMSKNAEGKKQLKTIKLNNPVIADYSRDYLSVEPFTKKAYGYMLD